MRIVAISDTHNLHEQVEVPDGDVIVHAGDITGRGRLSELESFGRWWHALPHRHKVIIAGNHDFCFERETERSQATELLKDSHYLEDSAVELGGLKFYGSPWQPRFFDWAFNLTRGPALAEKWAMIPDDSDVVITHGPPHTVLDTTSGGEHVGCEELHARLQVVQPRIHIFGHIHEAYGVERRGRTVYANASTCTLQYQPLNPPLVFDL
ncbi:MAG: metallophosphatase domain-containing protein [Myxococcota bacterium]